MAQINFLGSVGLPGSSAILGSANVNFATDANHTMSATEFSNKFLNVTSTGSLSTTRNLVAPLNAGQEYVVQNNTTGGQSIVIIGATGTGITVANAAIATVVCDGTNYLQPSAAISFAGDLSGSSSTQTVVGIYNTPVSNTAPTSLDVLTFNGSVWTPAVCVPASAAGGDLGGSYPNPGVVGLQGKAVLAQTLGSGQNGYILTWVNASSQWQAVAPAVAALGGDLSGTTASATVAKINGTTISTAGGSLTTGKVLRVTGSSTSDWGAVDLANASAVTGTLPTGNQASQAMGGDVSGTTASATVAKIQGNTVTSGALTKGQFLIATSTSNWAATALSTDLTESSSTSGSVTVTQISGSGTTDDFGGTGATINLLPTETVFASSSTHPVLNGNESITTTDGATWVTIATYTPANNSTDDVSVTVSGVDLTGGTASGDFYRADLFYNDIRIGSSAPTLNPSNPSPQSIRSITTAGGGAPSARVQISSNTIVVQVIGPATSRTWHWSCLIQAQRTT